jgi:GNAT superfamily N-acetyltransferase
MEIRKSAPCDICDLMKIFDEARGTIATLGIDQWQDGYPSREIVLTDIDLSRSYSAVIDGEICGTFVLVDDGEVTYDKIYDGHWITGDDSQSYVAIHRVAISVKNRGQGVSTSIINYAADYAKALGRSSLRIDTHEGNKVMRRMLEKHGFTYCGIIYLENGHSRVAYEKTL